MNKKIINKDYKKVRVPITYSGNKYPLLDWIFENMPDFESMDFVDGNDIHIYDLFGGSGTFAVNAALRYPNSRIVYNELDEDICNIFKLVLDGAKNEETLNRVINTMLDIFRTLTDNKTLSDAELYTINITKAYKDRMTNPLWDIYKKNWYLFRDRLAVLKNSDINATTELLYLINTSFQGTLEYNANTKKYNNSLGDKNPISKIKTLKKFGDAYLGNFTNLELALNYDFKDVIDIAWDVLPKNAVNFFYFDPPYTNSRKHYNSGMIDGNSIDADIIKQCNDIDYRGGYFMISNYKNNSTLVNWAKEQGFRVLEKEHTKSIAGNVKQTVEMLIVNY